MTVPLAWSVQALCATYLIASYTHVRDGWSYRMLNWRPLVWVGLLSYSIYVWQQLFLVSPLEPATRWSEWVPEAWPARIALTLAAACASYYGVEKPVLRLRERIERRPASPAAVVASAP